MNHEAHETGNVLRWNTVSGSIPHATEALDRFAVLTPRTSINPPAL